MAGVSILGIVVGKLCHEKKLYSIILLKANKGSKIGFYYIILPLYLAICLQMKGDEKFPLDAKEIV